MFFSRVVSIFQYDCSACLPLGGTPLVADLRRRSGDPLRMKSSLLLLLGGAWTWPVPTAGELVPRSWEAAMAHEQTSTLFLCSNSSMTNTTEQSVACATGSRVLQRLQNCWHHHESEDCVPGCYSSKRIPKLCAVGRSGTVWAPGRPESCVISAQIHKRGEKIARERERRRTRQGPNSERERQKRKVISSFLATKT